MSNRKYLALAICLVILILAACTAASEEAVPTIQVDEIQPSLVSATGVVVPEREALLSVANGGIIEAVMVEEGELVSSGQLLVKLEGSLAQRAAVATAELELENARIALESLYKNTDLAAAEALEAAEAAERALEDLNNRELQQARAFQSVAEAEKALSTAERDLVILVNPPTQQALQVAAGNILLAEKNYEETLDQIADLEWQYKKYSSNQKLPPEIKKNLLTKIRRALKGLEAKRSLEHLSLENARSRYNDLLKPPDPVDVQVAEAEFAAAQARLGETERELERVLSGPQPGEIALLQAQIDKGMRDFETFSSGPDARDVALAEARISNAEAQLAAAQAMIADQELSAPFDGVISAVNVNPGEWISPGSPVLRIGNLDRLQVETTDLGENDVGLIEVGNEAVISFDSLPDTKITGTVAKIAPKSDVGLGVNYPVIIKLEQVPEALRWGMTAFVDIAHD